MPTRTINRSASMAKTAFGLGIASIVCLFSVELTLGIAPLGIIFALLSRTDDCKFDKSAKIGIVLCVVGYIAAICMIVSTMMALINQAGGLQEFIDQVINTIQNYPSQLFKY